MAPDGERQAHSSPDRDEQKGVVDEPTPALVRGVWVPGMPVGDVGGGTPATLAARDLGGAFLAAECFTHLSRGRVLLTPCASARDALRVVRSAN